MLLPDLFRDSHPVPVQIAAWEILAIVLVVTHHSLPGSLALLTAAIVNYVTAPHYSHRSRR